MRAPRSYGLCLLLLALSTQSPGGGKVYLVLGSDTAIWDGMDVARFRCTYSLSLYTDPARNAAAVMDATFRNSMRDSEGRPLRLTWWMMAGNIFRTATNTNVPVPNTMTLYLMNRYYGDALRSWGDELSLHYHTFVWTDYDGDGTYYWNQAKVFGESRSDFDATLAQCLLEENVYPVSFRSGWETMDNEWQQYLEDVLPFSMHNQAGAARRDTTEPIDNVIDWSRAPSTWVPYHPSPTDYQVPGSLHGWNLRAVHLSGVSQSLLETLFSRASSGTDQVACFWGHLPETDFLTNLKRVDSLAHVVAARYPQVTFHYCSAVEAMQRWMNSADRTPPSIQLAEEQAGGEVFWTVGTDETLFTRAPFVAVKDRYERVERIPCIPIGPRLWKTDRLFKREDVAKVGVAAIDSSGNCSTRILRYAPDDLFLDNRDPGYTEVHGLWTTQTPGAWGADARVATVAINDSAVVRWHPPLSAGGTYSIFVQVPPVSAPATTIDFRILTADTVTDAFRLTGSLPSSAWTYVGTSKITSPDLHVLEMSVRGSAQSGTRIAADVVKYSALVRERQLLVPELSLDFGPAIRGDTVYMRCRFQNAGTGALHVSGISSAAGHVWADTTVPMSIPPMSALDLPVAFAAGNIGTILDTLRVASDDPLLPIASIPVSAVVQLFFLVVDNADTLSYYETGSWAYSNAQAYGPTSRYSYLNSTIPATARFRATLREGGTYTIHEIVPRTANATSSARYLLRVGGVNVDSVFIDQNVGSGSWVQIFERQFAPAATAEVMLSDASGQTTSNLVLRADAVKFALVSQGPLSVPDPPSVPVTSALYQNYPNPFNPSTVISYDLRQGGWVRLTVCDLLGRQVALLVDERQDPGRYRRVFDAGPLASGVYVCRLQTGGFAAAVKIVLMR